MTVSPITVTVNGNTISLTPPTVPSAIEVTSSASTGSGVPDGGSAREVLSKVSSTDGDVEWRNVGLSYLNTVTAPGATETLDMDLYDVHDITLDTDDLAITMSCSDPGSGKSRECLVILRQPNDVAKTSPTWSNVSKWDASGNPPVMPTDTNASISVLIRTDDGSTFEGFAGTDTPKTKSYPLALSDAIPPSSNPATPKYILSGGSATTNAPAADFVAFKFDPSTDQTMSWQFAIPQNYVSSGTVRFLMGSEGTSGNVVWKAAIGRVVASSTDLDSVSTFYDTVSLSAVVAVPSTSTQAKEVTITLAGSYTAGQLVKLFLGRDADNASDTCASAALLLSDVKFEYVGND